MMNTTLYTQTSYSEQIRSGIFFNVTNSVPCLYFLFAFLPVPVAARSKAWFCGRSLSGIVSSNSAGSMDLCLLSVLRVVR